MSLLFTIAAFIVALGVLIVIHEYGHYLVARICGVKVLRFSVGFGKPLWTRRAGPDRTEWVIAALPFGGYVKMLDEREGPVAPHELHRAFNRMSVWRRILIVIAGPLANFVLAIVIYWGLFLHGVQEVKPIVAAPEPGSIAAASGLKSGETIVAVEGEPVSSWQDLRWRLLQLAIDRQPVRVETIDRERNANQRTFDLGRFDIDDLDGDPLTRIGLSLWMTRPDVPPVIDSIEPKSPADAAGLRQGDRVAAVDGREIRRWDELVPVVRASPGKALRLRVLRGADTIELTVRPDALQQNGRALGRIGAGPKVDPEALKGLFARVSYGPITALSKSLDRTWETSVFSLSMLGKMITGKVSWKNLSGPVTIADYAGQSARQGFGAYVVFLALISISLGVLNLLPIPLLDGGHLLYYLVELLKGSPVSERAMELGQRFGLTVLLFLMVFALYNDINRQLAG
ncbi:MAG TPA: RIP metalloprotease RseP [Burkholderiales bacterium]